MGKHNKMTDDDFFRRDDTPKEPFRPVSDEWQEVEWGTTPLGGDLSLAKFYDRDGKRCKKTDMAYMDVVIYTKDGEVVNSVMGRNPYP